jgi:ABC-type transporter Mla subunit MlaD
MRRSPRITWDQLRVGLVIAVAVLVLGVAIYKLGEAANLFAKRYTLIAYLPDANGLREGGSVMVAGQLAGTVKKIEFLPVDADTTRNLRLTLAVDAGVRDQIRRDSRGKLRTLGLLGDKVFDITPGTPRTQPLNDGDTVTVVQALDYEAVIAQASGAVNVSCHDSPRKSRRYLSSEAAISSGVPKNAMRRSLSTATRVAMRNTDRMSCETTTLVTSSSRCSFMMSRVIVPVLSGSSPDVGSS